MSLDWTPRGHRSNSVFNLLANWNSWYVVNRLIALWPIDCAGSSLKVFLGTRTFLLRNSLITLLSLKDIDIVIQLTNKIWRFAFCLSPSHRNSGNFNGFRVLAAPSLHGTVIVDVSQTLRRWTEGATCIRQGGHHVGHWPTFLVKTELVVMMHSYKLAMFVLFFRYRISVWWMKIFITLKTFHALSEVKIILNGMASCILV